MNKKKITALLMAAAMTVSLAACGGQQTTSNDQAASNAAAAGKSDVTENTVELYDSEGYNASLDAAVSDTDWETAEWHFACSTGDSSTWAKAGRYFAALMEESTDGKVKVVVDGASDALTNGDQAGGISALQQGNVVQVSMHSNLIYSSFDDRFNAVSLPFIFDSYDDVDAKLDGEAGDALKDILSGMGLHCFGIAENGFRQLTNSKVPVKAASDMSDLKIRVAGSNLLMESYKAWGADATNMNWSETYTALQQKTVDGQENPLPAIASASVQGVQEYLTMWDAYYDCLFFCMNGDVYDALTPEQQKVVEENGKKAVEYQRAINRYECEQLVEEWEKNSEINVIHNEDVDVESFKNATSGIADWYAKQLTASKKNPMSQEEAESFVALFTK